MNISKYKAPCKDCSERHIGCHANCEEYLHYARLRNTERDEQFKERMIERVFKDR